MIAIEISLLIIAYSLLIITIFLEIVCYFRNLETIETIGFTISLLILIVALTSSYFFESPNLSENTSLLTQFAMLLVAVTTPLNVLKERQHKVKPIWTKLFIAFSIILSPVIIFGEFLGVSDYSQYVVAIFLGISVVLSMLLIRTTKPHARIAHREKTERMVAIAFIVVIPISLMVNYLADLNEFRLQIGFTIPMVFIILAGSKLWDDLQRLSLFRIENNIKEQNFKNYSLTNREKEITELLAKGKTYQQITEILFISMPTVKTHASNIYRKCNVKSRNELIALLIN